MVRRSFPLHWLLLFAAGPCGAGCADLAAQRDPDRNPPPPSNARADAYRGDRTPPRPAPPLQISDRPTPPGNPVRLTGFIETPAEPLPNPPGAPALPGLAVPAPQDPPPAPTPETAVPLRELYRLAADRYAAVDGYVARLRRREVVAGKRGPEEVILVRFRKEPWSVYLRWIGAAAQGREVVHVKGRHGNQIHTLTCASDTPLGAGKRVSMPPDHPAVLARGRYPITETGVGALIDRYGRVLEAGERGDNRLGTLKYLGSVKRPESDAPLEAVLQLIPPGAEPALPRGGQRFWFFDATNLRFPVLIVAQDEGGAEVEYYAYDNFLFPARLRDDDFDPDRLWKR